MNQDIAEYIGELMNRQRVNQRPEPPLDYNSFKNSLQSVGRQYGRGGDTMLAHINPQEAEHLQGHGGSGTTNPQTGLPEFYDAGAGGGSGPGSGGGGGGPGGAGGGGGADPGDAGGGGGAGGGGDFGGRDVGGFGPDMGGFGRGPEQGGPAPGMGGMGGGPGGAGPGTGGVSGPDPGAGIGGADSSKGLTDTQIRGLIGLFGPPANLAHGLAKGVGSVIEGVERGLGVEPVGGFGQVGAPDPGPQGTTGDKEPRIATAVSPVGSAVEATAPVAPQALPAPSFLNLNPAMTALQQRAQIATFGTSGEIGAYRDPETQRYYQNLLQRTLIDDPNATLLPIETQYLNQVLGLDVAPESTNEQLIAALEGFNAPLIQ